MKLQCAAALALSVMSSFVMAAEHKVEMRNKGESGTMVFEPAVLKAEVGDTIHFVPTDMGHNSQIVEGMAPEGATSWKGKMNKPVSVTLDKEGVYVYSCRPHEIMAMVGVIVAGDPVNLADIKTKAESLQSKFMTNKKRLAGYLDQIQ